MSLSREAPGSKDLHGRNRLSNESARVQAERLTAELQRTLMQVPAAICITHGPDHTIQSANALYAQLVGNRDLVGKSKREAFPELEGQGVFDVLDRVYATGEPYVARELRRVWSRAGGKPEEGFVNLVYQPLRDGDNNVYGIMVHVVDVTDLVQSRREVEARREEQARLAQAVARINRELDEFAYIASHDLKAPLRGIASLAEWIEEDVGSKLTEDGRRYLDLLHARVRRMESLIEAILQYSRAGRIRGRVEVVDVKALLKECLELLSPPSTASVTVASDMPTFETERVPLQQVFLNLIGNALKHAKRPDVSIRIGVRSEGKFYRFSVQDDGPGIPAELQEKIWEIFQTLEPRDRVEGAGIGLALVKKNVVGRGGRAWVESRDGEGATFFFLWPKRGRKDEP